MLVSTPRPSMAEMEAEIAKVAATTIVAPLVNGGECDIDLGSVIGGTLEYAYYCRFC